jgi:hypothetical protein
MERNAPRGGELDPERLTVTDLEGIGNAVLAFMQNILDGMEKYYTDKGYLAGNN